MLFGTSWLILWGVWCMYACSAVYHFPGYYCIVCYYLKLRLSHLEERLKKYRFSIKRLPLRVKLSMIRRLLADHNELCLLIDSYNRFWKKYLTINYGIFILTICFLSYVVFISPIEFLIRAEYFGILSAHVLLVTIVTYSASTVSHFNEKLYRSLHSIYVSFKFPLDIKLKVSSEILYSWE